MRRDRCYHIETSIGPLRVHAEKKPNKRTTEALGELFKAARERYESKERIKQEYRGWCENGHEKGQRGCALCEDLT